MDYKVVIEEQIRELQKAQDKLSHNVHILDASSKMCEVSKAILALCLEASKF